MNDPQRAKSKGSSDRVQIHEVGPRDVRRNESEVSGVRVRARFVHRAVLAEPSTVELTSSVTAKWIPQLVGAEELISRLGPSPSRHQVLAPTSSPA